jgi:citrate synthase
MGMSGVSMTVLDLLYEAHHRSALRGNCSHHAVVLAAVGSGDYFKAIAAGLMTLGGLHAPLMATYDVLASTELPTLTPGTRIPGWGNGFVKDGPDPLWVEVHTELTRIAPGVMTKVDAITEMLHRAGKRIWPNPSCYTAAVALHLQIPRYAIGELLIRGRLKAWTDEFGRIQQEAPCLMY